MPETQARSAQHEMPGFVPQPFRSGNVQTILVVDDDPSQREGYFSLFVAAGYRVLAAASAEQGLALFEEWRNEIDLVVMDMALPGMDGAAACRVLSERGAAVPILMVSGYPRGMEAHLPPGSIGWFQKPVEVRQLLQAVQQALNARLTAASSRSPAHRG